MLEPIKRIIENVLMALYHPFGFAIIMAVLFMFVYMMAKEKGWKILVQQWISTFKTSVSFRRLFFLAFYTSMILFRTLLNRNLWMNPLVNVMGVWGLYNKNGELTTECIENLALFIPFTILLLWTYKERILGSKVKFCQTIGKSFLIVFSFSLSIEFLQLFFRLGTFQLSDLFYNTLGGVVGGVIYWLGYKTFERNKRKEEI